jgi:hypothetical protein
MKELARLYLLKDQRCGDGEVLTPAVLDRHLRGEQTVAIRLVTDDGYTRTLVIDFPATDGGGEKSWSRLCEVANALQERFLLPAPAVSISGGDGYSLWLSLEVPVPVAQAGQFLRALLSDGLEKVKTTVELPPCLHQSSGKWAAFINPGMGASFAEDTGLEMAPPIAAQAAFLEGLRSISAEQFAEVLGAMPASLPVVVAAAAPAAAPAGLLLKDATLEDIVKFLHEKNIEPTFRHLIPK